MTALTEFLFPAPAERSTAAIARWWERRRLPFNLIVGTAGLLSLGAIHLLAALPPHAHAFPVPWQPVVVFAVLANVCYTFGPIAEVAVNGLWRERLLPIGPTLYRMGLTFSVGLALLPSMLAGLEWAFRLLRWVL